MAKLVDLSHDIEDGMITYSGLPGPLVSSHLDRATSRSRYAPGTEFQIDRISMVGNTGTYLDSPRHRYADGNDLASLPLESVAALEGVVVRRPWEAGLATDADAFEGLAVEGRAVIVHTGWSARWRTVGYFEAHPHLTAAAARLLASRGAALVGIDSLNIDATSTGERPAHSILLAEGIPIVEHLRGLDQLPDTGFLFFAVPPRVRDFGTFPVRAFAMIH
jgi:kynurenine formamidase